MTAEDLSKKINQVYQKATTGLESVGAEGGSKKPREKALKNGKQGKQGERQKERKTREKKEEEKEVELTVLDTFAIPSEFLETEKVFLKWFEKRFFKLNEEGIERFNQKIKEALEFIEEQPFVLSPKEGEMFPVSKKIKEQVSKGFSDVKQIMSFLKKVALRNTPKDSKKFFSPNKKSKTGAQRLSVCRILSIAYALEFIERSNDLNKFIEYSRFVLGRTEKDQAESGLLATLITQEKLKIFPSEEKIFNILSWVKTEQTITGCYLNNIGSKNKKSYYIPLVKIGFKDGLRGLLKVIREPKREVKLLDDFLRIMFVFSDDKKIEDILEIMKALEEEADLKKDPKVEIEFREKNYFTPKERKEYFPERKKKGRMWKGFLKNMKFDKNPSTGGGYKNMSAKVKLKDKSGKMIFGFEIQFLRAKEHADNERLESKSNHFLLEMKQATMLISRMNGKLTREEFIEKIKEYLNENIDPVKFPQQLIDDVTYTSDSKKVKEKEVVTQPFTGSINSKAKASFDFLVAIGTLRKVAPNFPSRKKPTRETREKSIYYLHESSMYRILEFMEYHKKEA